jgi:hypothetical protein
MQKTYGLRKSCFMGQNLHAGLMLNTVSWQKLKNTSLIAQFSMFGVIISNIATVKYATSTKVARSFIFLGFLGFNEKNG